MVKAIAGVLALVGPLLVARGEGPLATAARSAGAPPGASSQPAATATGCALTTLPADSALTADCMACHASGHAGSMSHPVGMDYRQAEASSGGRLRPATDVRQRGVFLPDGKVACVTCHDPRSPWGDHIALPPGATPRLAVRLRDPETYDPNAVAQPGAPVTPTPLCVACHAFD